MKLLILTILLLSLPLISYAKMTPDFLDKECGSHEKYKNAVIRNVNAAAYKHKLDPVLLLALIQTESSGKHYYENYSTVKRGGSGEVGLCQEIPSRTSRVKCKYNLWNLKENIYCCAEILRVQIDALNDKYPGISEEEAIQLALGAYNTGKPRHCKYSRKVYSRYLSLSKELNYDIGNHIFLLAENINK